MTETPAQQIAGTWEIDPTHSEVAFTIRHLMSKVRGTFAGFAGTIQAPTDEPTEASVEVSIELATVNTNNAQRDEHLLASDVFNVEANKSIDFKSTSITPKGGNEYTLSGDLTINGVTKPVDLDAEFLGVETDAFGAVRLGAEASTTISKDDFGISFNVPLESGKLLLGDQVKIELTIQATRA